ncbi:hypothetical protein SCARD494_08995 [Seiridium cardinale]
MGVHTASKAAHLPLRPARRQPSRRLSQTACNENPQDNGHMKRRARPKQRGSAQVGKPSRTRDEPSNDLVESWLEKSATPYLNVAAIPTDVANPPKAHHGRSRQGYNDKVQSSLPYQNEAIGRHERFLQTAEAPLPPVTSTRNTHGYRRKKRPLSRDSSLISTAYHDKAPAAYPYSVRQHAHAYDETSQHDSGGELDASDEELGAQRSASPRPAQFEKRPRHKTREDRYDTEKGRHQPAKCRDDGAHPRSNKRRKDDRRKLLLSSKNVMENFNSDAVMQDRITMPQPLVPGIFKNGREATIKPVTDLAYTEMQFLQNGRKDVMPKSLSKKRLKELEKQSKEIEEVSSFFLPAKKAVNNQYSKLLQVPTSAVTTYRTLDAEVMSESRAQDVSETSESENNRWNESARSLRSYNYGSEVSRYERHDRSETPPHSRKTSKATTYFTWSRSATRSPFPTNRQASPDSPGQEMQQSTTPDAVKKTLVDSGIFRGTGVPGYDDSSRKFSHGEAEQNSDAKIRQGHLELGTFDDEMIASSSVSLEDGEDTVEGQTSLKTLWQTRFASEWQKRERDSSHDAVKQSVPAGLRDNRSSQPRVLKNRPKKAPPKIYVATPDATVTRGEALSHSRGQGDERFRGRVHAEESSQETEPRSDLNPSEPQSSDPDERVSLASKDIMPPPPRPSSQLVPPLTTITSHMNQPILQDRYLPTEAEIAAAHRVVAESNAESTMVTDGPRADRQSNVSRGSAVDGDGSTFSSIQTASWLPRTQTPASTAFSRSTNTSRNSTTCPLPVSQKATRPERGEKRVIRAQIAEVEESLADYIDRIEREVRHRSPDYAVECLRVGDQPQNWDHADVNALIGSHNDQLRDETQIFGATREQESLEQQLNDCEWQYQFVASNSDDRDVVPDEDPRLVPRAVIQETKADRIDGSDGESKSMSEFWRPNQFLRF